MVDTLTKKARSERMARIRGRDTKPEVVVRRLLHQAGFRYRLHRRDLPGRPDIVLPKYRAVVLVNGCFWHRHPGCKVASNPKSNAPFWKKKFATNVKRDRRNHALLRKLGWRVFVIWECSVCSGERASSSVRRLANKLEQCVSGS